MISLRLILAFVILLSTPSILWAQASIESLPNLETTSTFIKPSIFNTFYSYFIFASIGALVIATSIWYSLYNRKHQHPFKFLEATENSAAQLMEDGKIEEAIDILTKALETIENNPLKFPTKYQSRNGAIWMLKRKIEELEELLIEN